MPKKIEVDEETRTAILENYRNGVFGKALFKLFPKVSISKIYSILRQGGISPAEAAHGRGLGGKGIKKLDDAQEAEIARLYSVEKWSYARLQDRFHVDHRPISAALKKHGIEPRERTVKPIRPETAEKILARRRAGANVSQLCDEFSMRPSRVKRLLSEHGLLEKKAKRDKHWLWKGGRTVNKDGYVRVLLPASDPLYLSMADSVGYVMEHRLVKARELGRPLAAHEHVHHKDGSRANNKPENLQLTHGSHGAGASFQCAVCDSSNLQLAAAGTQVCLYCRDCGSTNIKPTDLG